MNTHRPVALRSRQPQPNRDLHRNDCDVVTVHATCHDNVPPIGDFNCPSLQGVDIRVGDKLTITTSTGEIFSKIVNIKWTDDVPSLFYVQNGLEDEMIDFLKLFNTLPDMRT